MQFLVHEFITGGALASRSLPPMLAREGRMMLTTLLRELNEAGFRDILCPLDRRVAMPAELDAEFLVADDHPRMMREAMASADIIWIIAPETGNVLFEAVTEASNYTASLIASAPATIALTSSKTKILRHLEAMNIPVVAPVSLADMPAHPGPLVVKPDNGAGGEGCCRIESIEQLHQYLAKKNPNHYLIQPYIPGVPASLSMVCYESDCSLLACNRQVFEFDERGKGIFKGVIVNGLRHLEQELAELAGKITRAIPGLRGYIGVDFILTSDGPRIIEVNPRLTTAYAGLPRSLALNVASLILDSLEKKAFPSISACPCHAVPIRL